MKTAFNLNLLQNWVEQNGKQGRVRLAFRSGIGYDTVGRILRGERLPSKIEQAAIARATKIKKSELFPAG